MTEWEHGPRCEALNRSAKQVMEHQRVRILELENEVMKREIEDLKSEVEMLKTFGPMPAGVNR